MENKLDWQVGDDVTCLTYGEGIIVKIYNEIDNDLKVEYPNLCISMIYNYGGKMLLDCKYGKKRTLFHGHNLEVKVNEKKPKRHKWVNIYVDKYNIPFFGAKMGRTCSNAISHIPKKPIGRYITTIQLKPAVDDDKEN